MLHEDELAAWTESAAASGPNLSGRDLQWCAQQGFEGIAGVPPHTGLEVPRDAREEHDLRPAQPLEAIVRKRPDPHRAKISGAAERGKAEAMVLGRPG